MITPDQLAAAVTACPVRRAEYWAPWLNQTWAVFGTDTPARQAAWLAQIGHESGSFRYVRELWGPTPQQRRYEPPSTLATRLGNTRRGDGLRYLGRGLIQTTGRDNYARLRDELPDWTDEPVPDFEAEPQLVEQPLWAALSAGLYWQRRELNALADEGDFDAITQRINGGQNGRDDRRARWALARSVLCA